MITGLFDLASKRKTPEEIQPNFLKWMPALDRYVFERDEEKIKFEYNPGEIPGVDDLENFTHGVPLSVYPKGGAGTTRLLFKQIPGGFFLTTTNPQNKTEETRVFKKLSQLAKEAFEPGEQITAEIRKDQINFKSHFLTKR